MSPSFKSGSWQRAVRRSGHRLAALQERLGRRGAAVFSGLSLLWGLISGICLKRDFAHSRQLVAYLALLVAASALCRIWLEYAQRVEGRATTVHSVRQFLVAKPKLVATVAHFATQCAVQYITMFCIPLLALAGAWITLGLAVALAAISLVDPWWLRLAVRPWCMAGVRSFATILAAAFVWPVCLPQHLAFFYPGVVALAVIASLPGDVFLGRPLRRSHLAPVLVVALAASIQSLLPSWWRLPLLSIWLQDPALGTELADHELSTPWDSVEDQAVLTAAGSGVCCYSPIVSPSGIAAPVTHEWVVNGNVVDRIVLTAVRGLGQSRGKDNAFRTFSCKHHLPAVATIRALGCRVYLNGNLYLGQVTTSFR